MTRRIGTSTNTSDSAILSPAIIVSPAVSITILAADDFGSPPRIKVIIFNDGPTSIWIKLQSASIDNDKKGFRISANTIKTILEGSDIYTGEISAIADVNLSTVYITSY